jgi:hypothetical protein
MLVGGSLVCEAGFAVLTQGTRRRVPVVVARSLLATFGAGLIATLAGAAMHSQCSLEQTHNFVAARSGAGEAGH